MSEEINEFLKLEVLDSPMLEQTNFGDDMNRWLTDVVDIINSSFSVLDDSFNKLITASGIDAGGTWPLGFTVPVIGLTSAGFVNVSLISSSNPNVEILSVVPGLNSFDITFTLDPGPSAIIVYQAFMQQPQGI